GQLDDAVAACRTAIKIDPKYASAHNSLGVALVFKAEWEGAIASFRTAIKLDPRSVSAHSNLGTALMARGQLDGAIEANRKVIALKPDHAEAHCNLGQCLRQRGEFREALEHLRRGHDLGSRNPRWPYPSAQWVRQCERQVELDGKLPGFLVGKA